MSSHRINGMFNTSSQGLPWQLSQWSSGLGSKGPSSHGIHINKRSNVVGCAHDPVLESWKQMGPWGSLTSQPGPRWMPDQRETQSQKAKMGNDLGGGGGYACPTHPAFILLSVGVSAVSLFLGTDHQLSDAVILILCICLSFAWRIVINKCIIHICFQLRVLTCGL